MRIDRGFDDAERPEIARLYWAAFGAKLGRALGPEVRAQAFLVRALEPAHAFVARDASGAVLGVAGFRSPAGALVAGCAGDMVAAYGPVGALWRTLLLGLIAGDTDNTRFLVDGLAVDGPVQRQGVGSRLLEAVAAEAARRGYAEVRLDVVEGNDRARALYERRGFVAAGEVRHGLAGPLLGLRPATVMVRRL